MILKSVSGDTDGNKGTEDSSSEIHPPGPLRHRQGRPSSQEQRPSTQEAVTTHRLTALKLLSIKVKHLVGSVVGHSGGLSVITPIGSSPPVFSRHNLIHRQRAVSSSGATAPHLCHVCWTPGSSHCASYGIPRASDSVVVKPIIRRIIAAISCPSLTTVNTSNFNTPSLP